MVRGIAVQLQGNRYYVNEPAIPQYLEGVYRSILDRILSSAPAAFLAENREEVVQKTLLRVLEELGLKRDFSEVLPIISYYVLRDGVGYGKIDVLMNDPHVEEISASGADEPVMIVHKLNQSTRWVETNVVFSGEELDRFVIKLAQKCGSSISAAFPIREVRTPEGHRAILFYGREVTGKGSSFVIRKFPSSPITITQLIKEGTLSSLEASYLWLLLENKKPMLIVGEMASGKTTLLSSLASLIPPDASIVTIEDTPELSLQGKHWLPLYTRSALSSSDDSRRFSIGFLKLIKAALRTRADYVIPGEVRGREAKLLISQVFALGHGGLTTFHASNASSAIKRLSAEPIKLGTDELSLISAIATIRRVKLESGWVRRVLSIDEVVLDGEGLALKRIFTWDKKLDLHAPSSVREVVRRSAKLKESSSVREASFELALRRSLLEKLARMDIAGGPSLSEVIVGFYSGGREVEECLRAAPP